MSTAGAPAPPLPPLAYASPDYAAPPIVLYRIGLLCWAVPLVVGVGLLALYALTFARQLPGLGLLTMLAGAVLWFVGLACLFTFKHLLQRCAPDVRAAWLRRARPIILLLVLNMPVAIACAFAGMYLASHFPVTLVNATSAPITDITVTAPGQAVHVLRLDPGEKRRVLLQVEADGEVTFSATQSGAAVSGTAAGYVTTGGANGRSLVRFTLTGPIVRED